jgi:hypothetical protein
MLALHLFPSLRVLKLIDQVRPWGGQLPTARMRSGVTLSVPHAQTNHTNAYPLSSSPQKGITEVRGLEGCPALERLWLPENRIGCLAGLSHLTALRELYVYGNRWIENLGCGGGEDGQLRVVAPRQIYTGSV